MARWPVHPVPLTDETFSSWVTRLSRANAATVSTWFAALDGRYRNPTWMDYHLDDKLAKFVLDGTGLAAGRGRLESMTLESAIEHLSIHGSNRWVLSTDTRVDQGKHRFCRRCFASDTTPYLRREWRFQWVHWCRVHDQPLDDRCPRCQAVFQPWRVRWDRPFASCSECEFELAEADAPRAVRRAPDFVKSVVNEALAAAYAPLPKREPEETAFEAVWSLQKWAELVGAEFWPQWLEALAVRGASGLADARENERAAWSFAIAWKLVAESGPVLDELVRRHRSSFNRATSTHCPPSVAPLRKLIVSRVKLSEADVSAAIERLLAAQAEVNFVTVSDAAGVSEKRIADNDAFRALVEDAQPRVIEQWCGATRKKLTASRERLRARGERVSRAQLASDSGVPIDAITKFERHTGESLCEGPTEQHSPSVRDAVAALEKANKRVTKKAVAAALGMDRSVFDRSPELSAIVEDAQERCPSAEAVEQACRQIETEGERVTVVAIARLLGCGKHHLERNKALKEIVEHYQRYERFHREAEVTRAAAKLRKAGEKITVASLCRVMGRHRSYIEKREWLRQFISHTLKFDASP